MSWGPLYTQFCLELAFGVLLAMAFVPRAPVGVLFYRIMGTSALVPALVAAVAPPATGGTTWTDPVVLCSALPVLTYPLYSGPLRGWKWGASLAAATLGCAAAIGLLLARGDLGVGGAGVALAFVSALATGAVAGSIGLAMVLGHWYLTIPNLAIRHLQRLNRVCIACLAVSAVAVGASMLFHEELVNADGRAISEAFGLFHLGTRVAVGIALPALFAAMAASSLRYKNTRSATGILYASTVLVLIGTALSISLQDAYRFPL